MTSPAPPRDRTFAVVPAYNEAAAIGDTLRGLARTGYQVVVVDDGSADGTAREAAAFPVHLVRHPINLGQGAALQTGVSYALRAGAEYVVHFDADGQHSAEEIDELVAPLARGEADVALGSRFLRAADTRAVPPGRRRVLRVARFVNWALTGVLLSDAHNGFRAMTRAAATRVFLEEDGFAHASEVVWLVRRHRLRYVEVPTAVRYTAYSVGKGQSAWNGFNTAFDFLVGRFVK